MIVFLPKLTELIVFDLEAFVPECDRRRKTGASLSVNPYRKDHTLLGGVVYRSRPLLDEVSANYQHHWIWNDGSEEEVVKNLYHHFTEVWKPLAAKKRIHCDPIVAGIGISTFDMPFLTAKCLEYEVAAPEEIYETICKVRVVDLATAGIGFLQIPRPVLHPCTHNELANGLLGIRDQKPTGKRVWEMADEKDYSGIEKRCEEEVREMVALMNAMKAACEKTECDAMR
ncbi:hypothetical protein McpSp1_15390 [Methanocorpusculaceae archaeon Sp1]|nr:hypothetical protein [Methanocorpusculaceae archaeon Sp1]